MSNQIHVEAARIPDRDRLLQELEAHGVEATAVDEVGIDVPVQATSSGSRTASSPRSRT